MNLKKFMVTIDELERENFNGYQVHELHLTAPNTSNNILEIETIGTDVIFLEADSTNFQYAVNGRSFIQQVAPMRDVNSFPFYRVTLKNKFPGDNTVKFIVALNPFNLRGE